MDNELRIAILIDADNVSDKYIKIKALIARKKPGADSVTWVDPKVLKRMAREAAAEAAAQEGEGNV